MQITEMIQVRVTLSKEEYDAVMANLKKTGMDSVSDLLRKAVKNFCSGWLYTIRRG